MKYKKLKWMALSGVLLTIFHSSSVEARILPSYVENLFQTLFSGVPSEPAMRTYMALIAFMLYWFGLSMFLYDKNNHSRFKGVRIMLAIVLAIITGIGIPSAFLTVIFGGPMQTGIYGTVFGLIIMIAPIVGLGFIAYNLPRDSFGKITTAFIMLVIVALLYAVQTMGGINEAFGNPMFGNTADLTIKDVIDIASFILVIWAGVLIGQTIAGRHKQESQTGLDEQENPRETAQTNHIASSATPTIPEVHSELSPDQANEIENFLDNLYRISKEITRLIENFKGKFGGNDYAKVRKNLDEFSNGSLGQALNNGKYIFKAINHYLGIDKDIWGNHQRFMHRIMDLRKAYYYDNTDIAAHARNLASRKNIQDSQPSNDEIDKFLKSLEKFEQALIRYCQEYQPDRQAIRNQIEQASSVPGLREAVENEERELLPLDQAIKKLENDAKADRTSGNAEKADEEERDAREAREYGGEARKILNTARSDSRRPETQRRAVEEIKQADSLIKTAKEALRRAITPEDKARKAARIKLKQEFDYIKNASKSTYIGLSDLIKPLRRGGSTPELFAEKVDNAELRKQLPIIISHITKENGVKDFIGWLQKFSEKHQNWISEESGMSRPEYAKNDLIQAIDAVVQSYNMNVGGIRVDTPLDEYAKNLTDPSNDIRIFDQALMELQNSTSVLMSFFTNNPKAFKEIAD